jgi:hypothetical protein
MGKSVVDVLQCDATSFIEGQHDRNSFLSCDRTPIQSYGCLSPLLTT